MTPELKARAIALLKAYESERLKIATAESCTGGLVAALLTEIVATEHQTTRQTVMTQAPKPAVGA